MFLRVSGFILFVSGLLTRRYLSSVLRYRSATRKTMLIGGYKCVLLLFGRFLPSIHREIVLFRYRGETSSIIRDRVRLILDRFFRSLLAGRVAGNVFIPLLIVRGGS